MYLVTTVQDQINLSDFIFLPQLTKQTITDCSNNYTPDSDDNYYAAKRLD